MAPSRDIILYHYSYSPFARRIVWYLNLRRIPYSQCMQPPTWPRPDVMALGTVYRRIPLMAIGRDIYHDTRLILRKLEEFFPVSDAHPAISASNLEDKATERLLDFWIIDGGIFARAAQLIPTSMPLLKDPKFNKDREQFTGRSWNKDAVEAIQPEALVDIKAAFAFLEETLLADGRDWILKGKGPSLADIEAAWSFFWLIGLKDALSPDQISAQHFPKLYAWMGRFQSAVSAAAKEAGKPRTLKGQEAASLVGTSSYAESSGDVDPNDPSKLQKGDQVEVWPIDTGFRNKDRGKLVALSVNEIVIEGKTQEGKEVRLHAPRHGFRLRALGQGPSAKL